MPPKKPKIESKTSGLLNFFAKQQSERNADDSCQIVFEKPPETPKNSTKWSETLQKCGESSGKDWQNPFSIAVGSARKNDTNLKNDLLANGFDEIHGNCLFYPIDELIRGFEMNLVRSAASSNCCLALPSSAPSSFGRISAVLIFNFLKWFPRSRVLLIGSSDAWQQSLQKLGLDTQITKVTTLTHFRNLKTQIGRVLICTTPMCALKVVESAEARDLIEDIRLVLMDLKPNECCSKYKPILSALTVKDTFLRCVVLTTATSNASRRTASITKRQQMITNLQLSDWIELAETDFGLRSSNIPPGIELKSWKSENNSEKLLEIIRKFEEFCETPIDEMARDGLIASRKIWNLVWTDWKLVKNGEFAEFLTTIYKLLVIDGVETARNFVKTYSGFSEAKTKILEIFGGFSEFPAKFQILADAIQAFLKMDNHVRGVVLCRDTNQAIEIQNFLELTNSAMNCVRIVDESTPTARNLWQISRLSTVFQDVCPVFFRVFRQLLIFQRKSPKILILPIKIRDFIGYSEGLRVQELTFVASINRESVFNFRRFGGAHLLIANDPMEELRPDDGRLIVEDGKFEKNKGKVQKMGAVERYDFKFEPSRLRIDTIRMPTKFFYPRNSKNTTDGDVDGNLEMSRLGKTQIEMSSKEHAELFRRLKNLDFSRFSRKKRSFLTLDENCRDLTEMDDEQVIWNTDVQYLGDIKSSRLSQRLSKYLKDGPFEWAMSEKRRFQFVNEISDERRTTHLSRLIRQLDAQFELFPSI